MNSRASKALIAIFALVSASAVSAVPTTEELLTLIQKQQAEIDELKKDQAETSSELKKTDSKVEATADAIENIDGSASLAGSSAKTLEWASKTRIGGYGEHHYNNFSESDDQIDAHRFVLYVAHDYSDTVRFFSELELEHSLAGDGKPGEVELEQAYIEWDFAQKHSLVAGQFLLPVGILNETHEPDTFYGVERNLVEKNIIPTTWWESGIMVNGEIAPGLSYDVALHSGLNTDEGGKIRDGRQKSEKAVANDFAYTARVKYTGIAGLELAATVQLQEDILQGNTQEAASATLTELHGIWQIGSFNLRALYADWSVDGDNFEATGRDNQQGWYLEPSYKLTHNFGIFVRYSSWNNEAGFSASEANEAIDYGVNYWLTSNVVFKADYQDASKYNENDSFNLGIGWSF